MPQEQPPSRSQLARSSLIIVLLLGVMPLVTLAVAMIPPPRMISFIGAVLIFQPFAAPVGLMLNIPAAAIVLTMFFLGLGAIVLILTVCDLFAWKWERLSRAIQNVQEKTAHSARFSKYGILMFFQFIWIPGIGLYGCALIAWLFAWRRPHQIAVLVAAWMAAVFVILLISLGISRAFM